MILFFVFDRFGFFLLFGLSLHTFEFFLAFLLLGFGASILEPVL